MALKDTYAYAVQKAQGIFHGTMEEQNGKFVWKGTVGSDAEKNEIWNAFKTIPTWQNDIAADIRVTGVPGLNTTAAGRTYTVKAGDTLSQIAKDQLGHANDYMKIFELNKDQLSDPDKIKPGQVLRLP